MSMTLNIHRVKEVEVDLHNNGRTEWLTLTIYTEDSSLPYDITLFGKHEVLQSFAAQFAPVDKPEVEA